MSDDVRQVEPIGDDDLQRLRDVWSWSSSPYIDRKANLTTMTILRILARLDAAESRCAELQREVERLHEESAGEDV